MSAQHKKRRVDEDDESSEEEEEEEEESDFVDGEVAEIPTKVGPLVVEEMVAIPIEAAAAPQAIVAEEDEEEQDFEKDDKQTPQRLSQQSSAAAQTATPKPPAAVELSEPSFFANLKQIKLPNGKPNELIGKYLIEQNRPMNTPQIVQKFKDLLTKAQTEKAIFTLVQSNVLLTLEDSKQPLYWVNQTLVEEANQGDYDLKAINAWAEKATQDLAKREELRLSLQQEVKELIAAPSDELLDAKISEEMGLVAKLKPRVAECKAVMAEAEKMGQSAAQLQAGMIAESKKELLFYRNEWRKRKAHLMEFVERVCESKGGGLRGAAKRELIEKMGVETDESVNVKWLKGTDLV